MKNRIEEVKKIIESGYALHSIRQGMGVFIRTESDEKLARQICRLFPQPLDDKFHRPAVLTFANAMEHRLRDNENKGGWGINDCTEEYLNDRLVEELV